MPASPPGMLVVPTFQTYPATILSEPNLVNFWRLNEEAGSFFEDYKNPNYVYANPSFETNTTGWQTTGGDLSAGATLTRVAGAVGPTGAFCGQVVTTNALAFEGVAFPLSQTFISGVTYTISVYAKGNAGGEAVQLLIDSASGGLSALNITLTTSGVRYSLQWTPSANTAATLYFRTQGASAYTFKIDCFQISRDPAPVTYSDGGNFLTGNGGFTPNSTGQISGDKAVALNGTTGYLQASNNTAVGNTTGLTTGFTIEGWCNPSTFPNGAKLWQKASGATNIFNWGANTFWGTNGWEWDVGSGTGSPDGGFGSGFFNMSAWNYFATGFDGVSQGYVYINGASAATWTITASVTLGSGTNPFQVGDTFDGTTHANFMAASFQSVAFYNTLLVPGQAGLHYARGVGAFDRPGLQALQGVARALW